jgi:hypothetical protein
MARLEAVDFKQAIEWAASTWLANAGNAAHGDHLAVTQVTDTVSMSRYSVAVATA